MRIFSVLAHPRNDSFCHAISACARAKLASGGHEIDHHDLYAENFSPLLTENEAYTFGDDVEEVISRNVDPLISRHRTEISQATALLVVHPNWWGKPPAILAGWVDRVLVPGVAYRLSAAEGTPAGLLNINKALVLNTSDTPEERETAVFGDPLELIWGKCVLPFCGVHHYKRAVFRPVGGSTEEERQQWLDEAETLASTTFY